MTNNSKRLKRLKKYSHITKRCKYRCKKSIRNNILYGGGVDQTQTLTFSVSKNKISANQYILTKKRPLFSFEAGIGTYQLDEIIPGKLTSIINPCTLEMFIEGLKESYPRIFYALYKTLKTESLKYSFNFNFKSLLKNVEHMVEQIAPTELTQSTVDNDKISIAGFSELPIPITTDQNYIKLEIIYDSLLIKQPNLIKLKETYQDFPLLKIDPTLPTLIKKDATEIGHGSFGIVYKVTIASKQYALKQITIDNSPNELNKLMNGEVIAYNTISQLVCGDDATSNNTLFFKLIRAYVDFTSNNIYVLMEYCGNALYKTTIHYKPSIQYYVYKWLLNTANGLKCMHDNNYAHLDIKPDNIVIDDKYESKLIDFGLIFKFTEDPKDILKGTTDYMPIDVFNTFIEARETTKIYNEHAKTNAKERDVYSLGMSFIECAFNLKHHDTYIAYGITEADFSILYGILRYVPSDDILKSIANRVPLTQTITLNIFGRKITSEDYSLNDSPHAQLFKYIFQIHNEYPIFRRMIQQKKKDRCTIDDVILECKTKLKTLAHGIKDQ